MKRRVRFLAIAAALAAAVLAGGGDSRAQGGSALHGSWGFSATGVVEVIHAAAVGVMTFDNAGGCSITDTINVGGVSFSRTSSACSYVLGSNGMGTISVTFPGDPAPVPLAFVLVDNNRELRFIRTDVGIAEGVAKRQ
jgi:hypothetical protein